MKISKQDWLRYVEKLSKISQTASDMMKEYIDKNGISDTDAIVKYAYALATKYGEASAELSCQMYDEIAELSGVTVDRAMPAATATFSETEKAIRGSLKQSVAGNLLDRVAYRLVKQAGADTTLQNARRDGAEWAWIPSGDTCAFCLTLASNGWQKASKKILHGTHAEHIHANCDCQFAIRFDGESGVSGYDYRKYREMYENAEGNSSEAKIKSLRKQLEDRDKINAQKRVLYKENKIKELSNYLNRAKNINNEAELMKVTKSDIINMQSYEEVSKYFLEKDIELEGFDKKDIFDIKRVFSSVDDGIKLMPESEEFIKRIVYNPKLKVLGKMSSDGIMQIGKDGLKDYGTGLHETAHAFDFAMSNGTKLISTEIVENARKKLKFRSNSKEYLNLRIMLCGTFEDAQKMEEVFAYAVETDLSGIYNKLSEAIVEELKNRK